MSGVDMDVEDYAPYDNTLKLRIMWEKFKGTSRQKQVFKYLSIRFQEIKDQNEKKKYDRKIDIPNGSLKKEEYKVVFDNVWDLLGCDTTYNYILEGLQFWIESNYDDVLMAKEVVGDCSMCSICRDQLMSPGKEAKMLHCRHAFHSQCINMWLQRDNRCPMCRTPQQ